MSDGSVGAVEQKLAARISYDAASGCMTWRPLSGDSAEAQRWNKRYAGGRLGYVTSNGYVKIHFDGQFFHGHRLAWFLHFGCWPVGLIDHIDGVRSNNAIENLREATPAQNCQNRRALRGALKGVTRVQSGKWVARIGVEHRRIHLGTFDSADEASAAYASAAAQHFGPFARAA